ncbi:MAG TPA: hypothetical protein VNE82_00235 [Candidatus Binataceae bacterium]|nr:hypothetical protein [Candidatus Binataceae bacterium]
MSAQRKRFLVELINPSHYADQGYIIQWWRGFIGEYRTMLQAWRRIAEIFATYVPALWYLARLELLRWRIRRDPEAKNYSDVAISPAAQDDNRLFELYRRTGMVPAEVHGSQMPPPLTAQDRV